MQIIPKDFNGQLVDFIENNGELWLPSEAIGKALEYNNPKDSILKIYERNKEELADYSDTVKLTAPDGKKYPTRVFSEEGVMVITMLSRQPKSVEFRRWAVKVLKAFRRGELLAMNLQADKLILTDKVFASATRFAKNAGLSGKTARIKAAKMVKDSIGVDVFNQLEMDNPGEVLREVDFFLIALDRLIAEGRVVNHVLHWPDKIAVRFAEAFKMAVKEANVHLTRQDYNLIQDHPRFITRKKVYDRMLRKSVDAWVFTKEAL